MKSGDIILVKFPFTNLQTTKKRPCLVMTVVPYSKTLKLITIAMVTSQVDGLKLTGDVYIKDWEKSGLLHMSLVRLAKVATIEMELAERKLGTLSIQTEKEVKKQFVRLYSHWI